MSSVIDRGREVAQELLDYWVDPRTPLGQHETMLRLLIIEAFARGYVAGLERGQSLMSVIDAGEAARAELEAARAEIADDGEEAQT